MSRLFSHRFAVVAAETILVSACYGSTSDSDGQDADSQMDDNNDGGEAGDGGDGDDGGEVDAIVPPPGMLYVPAGLVLLGSASSTCPYDEPLHEAYLAAFYIDRFETTNAEYAACIDSGACAPPLYDDGSSTRSDYLRNAAFSNHPVISLDWERADFYCRWAGKRLPTEAEWEKAARGGCETGGASSACENDLDTRSWPWGDVLPDCAHGNVATDCVGDTDAVGSHPLDSSPYGALDMGGNAMEFVADWFVPDYYSWSPAADPAGPTEEEAFGRCPPPGGDLVDACRVIRGHGFGGTLTDAAQLPLSCRFFFPSGVLPASGVRCAMDVP